MGISERSLHIKQIATVTNTAKAVPLHAIEALGGGGGGIGLTHS
jgi:hypothetical protein